MVAEFHSKVPSLHCKGQGLFVFSLHAETATLPEISDGDEFPVIGLRLQIQDKINVPNGFIFGLFGHGNHAFSHAQMQIVPQRQACPHSFRKLTNDLLD